MKNRGLFLDFDGTLADSLHTLKEVYLTFLKDFGIEGTQAEFDILNGPPLNRVVEILKETHKLSGSADKLLKKYIQTMQGTYQNVIPSKGAKEVLEAARKNGWFVAVVTSNSGLLVKHWLQRADLGSNISLIIGVENVTEAKPAAEPYMKALSSLNCDAKNSYAVEDSQTGFQSARAAGIPTFLIQKATKLERYNMAIESLNEVIPFLCR